MYTYVALENQEALNRGFIQLEDCVFLLYVDLMSGGREFKKFAILKFSTVTSIQNRFCEIWTYIMYTC